MDITITLNNWVIQKEAASTIREKVFILEQQIPFEMEWDEMDQHCIHAVAVDSAGNPVGTGRLLSDGHIGRMAVIASARRAGVGGLLLSSLMQAAKNRGDKEVLLSAQTQVQGFYLHFGFRTIGEEYIEAKIKHINMKYSFE